MDREAFADKLRAALTDAAPFALEIERPPAEAQPTLVQMDVVRVPSFIWEHTVERGADGQITKMISRAVQQQKWSQVIEQ